MSTKNAKVKELEKLHTAKGRKEAELYLVGPQEGSRLLNAEGSPRLNDKTKKAWISEERTKPFLCTIR